MKTLKSNQPIIIGLAGKAGSGKTSVAEEIVPKGSFATKKLGITWDHIFFALPLYELASIRRNIKGFDEESRKLHAIHSVVYEIFGGSTLGNMPHYDNLVDIVKTIYNLPIEPEGVKPRTFLQKAGDVCRAYDENCFASWGIIKASNLYRQHVKSLLKEDEDLADPNMAIIISDVRFVNEAEYILKQPNGFVVCFDASDSTLTERLMKRDGKMMSDEQKSHRSEQQIEDIKNICSAIINTDDMTIEEQTFETLKAIGIMQGQDA